MRKSESNQNVISINSCSEFPNSLYNDFRFLNFSNSFVCVHRYVPGLLSGDCEILGLFGWLIYLCMDASRAIPNNDLIVFQFRYCIYRFVYFWLNVWVWVCDLINESVLNLSSFFTFTTFTRYRLSPQNFHNAN